MRRERWNPQRESAGLENDTREGFPDGIKTRFLLMAICYSLALSAHWRELLPGG